MFIVVIITRKADVLRSMFYFCVNPLVALALNEQILQDDEIIPALTIEDGHSSGHRDIKPDIIIFPDGELVLDSELNGK